MCSWLSYTEEVASDLPLGGDIVQRLQRFGTYGRLKQIALRKVAHNIASDSALVSDLRKAFQQLDTAGTGELASRQVTCMYALQDRNSNACMRHKAEAQVYVCITRLKLTCIYASQDRSSNACTHHKTEAQTLHWRFSMSTSPLLLLLRKRTRLCRSLQTPSTCCS